MNFIHHRINNINDLEKIPETDGVELDVRYHNNDLILEHDPFNHHLGNCTKFRDFLLHWNKQGVMILNIKTEGIEQMCINLMKEYKIESWFFLDLSVPMLCQYSNLANNKIKHHVSSSNLSVRFSEFEPIDGVLLFSGSVDWVWVDCFNNFPLTFNNYYKLKEAGFRICIVSPELQGFSISKISSFKKLIAKMNIDAVCSKEPNLWK